MAQIPANPSVDVESLKPFKKFIMTIGNLPTSYLESLTYAELVMWFCNFLQEQVIPAVNNNGSAVEELQGLYIELKSYVDNYFTDLDVQEEINIKLDEMAEDGTLTNLISNYVNPFIEEQNEEIESFKEEQNEDITNFKNTINDEINIINNKVNSATSGSPLVASNVSEMTNTDRIYVNTTDGKWYYYDGDSWEIGGTYQATQNADGSITYKMLDDKLQNSFIENTTTTNYQQIDGYWINATGTIEALNNYSYYDINPVPNDILKLRLNINPGAYANNVYIWCIKDLNGNIIKSKKFGEAIADETLINKIYTDEIEIPLNANKLLINIQTTSYDNYILKTNKYITTNINKSQLDDKLQNSFEDVYTNITPTILLNNAYINANSNIVSSTGNSVYQVNVIPGDKLKISTKQIGNLPAIIICTNNKKLTINVGGEEFTYLGGYEYITNEQSDYQYNDYEITVPIYCNKIYINKNGNNSLIVKKVTSYKSPSEEIDITLLNPLINKKIVYDGDSICESRLTGNVANGGGYPKLINDIVQGSYVNQARGGGILTSAIETGITAHSVVDNLTNLPTDGDLYCFEGGINDYWDNIPIGTFSDTYSDTFDISTVIGSLEKIFNYAINNFIGKPICFVIVHKIQTTFLTPNTIGKTFSDYRDAIIKVCNKYSIPYYDAFEKSGLNGWNSVQSANFLTAGVVSPDGCHPNENGYKKYYVPELIKLFNEIIPKN